MADKPTVTPWTHAEPPSEGVVRRLLLAESLSPIRWSNRPGEKYPVHTHAYAKVLVVVQGSITFTLPETGETFTLRSGDRLELPAGVAHGALVGAQGVACLEAHQHLLESLL